MKNKKRELGELVKLRVLLVIFSLGTEVDRGFVTFSPRKAQNSSSWIGLKDIDGSDPQY